MPNQRPPSPPVHRPGWLRAASLLFVLLVLLALALAVAGVAGVGGAWPAAGVCTGVAFALLLVVGVLAMRREARRPAATAYDLVVGAERAREHRPDGPAPVRVGWAGPEGPAIDPATWPRSPRTHQPMIHCATFEVPEEFRRRDPALVGLSVFDWPDALGFRPPPAFVAEALADGSPADPFWTDVARSRPHPHAHVRCDDDTGCFYAVVLLTEDELTGPRTARPRQGVVLDQDEGVDEASRRQSGLFGDLYRVERDDPNAGLAPVDDPADGAPGSVDVADRYERFAHNHLGGTPMDPFGLGRRTPSPWYLEVHRLGGLWVGDDENLVVDLAADAPVLQR